MEDQNTGKVYSRIAKKPSLNQELLNKVGREKSFITNNISISYSGKDTIYNYSVGIEPEIPQDARGMLSKIVKLGKKEAYVKEKLGEDSIFSGLNLYSWKEYKQAINQEITYEGQTYNLTFNLTGSTKMGDLSPEQYGSNSNIVTMLLNIIIKEQLKKMGYFEQGRLKKYYNSKQIFDNQVKYESEFPIHCHQGIRAGVSLNEDGQKLLIDPCSRVINTKTLLDCMNDYKTDEIAAEELIGKSVIANYGNHRNYKIDGFNLKLTPKSSFQKQDGSKITFLEYYQKIYGVKIKVLDQPLAIHTDKKTGYTILLVPELLITTGITDKQRQDYKFMNELAIYTKLTPEQRMNKVLQFAKVLQQSCPKDSKILIKSGVDSNQTKGLELISPQIKLGNKFEAIKMGQFQIRDSILSPISLKNWVFIYTSKGNRDDQMADRFLDDLNKVAKGFGINISNPGFLTVQDENPKNYIKVLENDIKKNGQPDFVLSMTFNKQNQIYSELKNFLICQKGIPHSHFTIKAYEKAKLSGVTKILTQINAKMGNPIWEVQPIQNCPKNLMIIGIDSSSFMVKGVKKTCTGIIATMNSSFNRTWSKAIVTINDKRSFNIIGSINQVIKEACTEYNKINKTFPSHIIIYKEGAGDSQITTIVQEEMDGIEKGFKLIDEKYKPQYSYIMFNKKINFRFFSQEQGNGQKGQNQIQNPEPGSLIYKGSVGTNYEFYLIPQKVTQGSATPTKYIICYNSFAQEFGLEFFAQLTYFQCYNYFNWSGAVRVPGVAQYARKLATLVGDTFQNPVHESLRFGQYYL